MHSRTHACTKQPQNEFCVTVEDFLARRTRLAFLDVAAARAAAPRVATIMAGALGWSEAATASHLSAALHTLDTQFTTAGSSSSNSNLPTPVSNLDTDLTAAA